MPYDTYTYTQHAGRVFWPLKRAGRTYSRRPWPSMPGVAEPPPRNHERMGINWRKLREANARTRLINDFYARVASGELVMPKVAPWHCGDLPGPGWGFCDNRSYFSWEYGWQKCWRHRPGAQRSFSKVWT